MATTTEAREALAVPAMEQVAVALLRLEAALERAAARKPTPARHTALTAVTEARAAVIRALGSRAGGAQHFEEVLGEQARVLVVLEQRMPLLTPTVQREAGKLAHAWVTARQTLRNPVCQQHGQVMAVPGLCPAC